MMIFRQAQAEDAAALWAVLQQARAALGRAGIDQWQGDYPNTEIVAEDIAAGDAYVLTDGETVAGAITVSFAGEPDYNAIEQGAWLSDQPYAVIHRMAIADAYKGQGLAARLMGEAEGLCEQRGVRSIKTDTDEKNQIMQAVLKKAGYTYCGIIYFVDSPKVAFEKVLG